MSDSICQSIPAKDYTHDLKIVDFVYETEHDSLRQPFSRSIYYLYLVTDGSATLKVAGHEHKVAVGDLFFAYPSCPYTLVSEGKFRYLYISFYGANIGQMFEDLGIVREEPVYRGFNKVSEFWFSAISRLNAKNANLLSESVLFYTLSFINGECEGSKSKQNKSTMFEMILEYVDNHYREPSLTLGSVSAIFSYTENYLSALFKKQMQLGFNQYVNNRRIAYALRLIVEGYDSVQAIATACGFSDALYFSKVFKKKEGVSPHEKIKQRT